MKPEKGSVQEQATQLPHREQTQLALRLIESLDPGHDEDVDELWLDEAESRLLEYDRGAKRAGDAEEAISEIERQLT
jgi:hypothetical protein